MSGMGPSEMLVIGAIITVIVAPVAVAGIVSWIVLSRQSRGPRD